MGISEVISDMLLNKHPVPSASVAEAVLVNAFLASDIMIFLKPHLSPTLSFSTTVTVAPKDQAVTIQSRSTTVQPSVS